jgi:hypothetical protein
MRAMVLNRIVSLDPGEVPLELIDLPKLEAQLGGVLVRVAACGVCHILNRFPTPIGSLRAAARRRFLNTVWS